MIKYKLFRKRRERRGQLVYEYASFEGWFTSMHHYEYASFEGWYVFGLPIYTVQLTIWE